jgi:two-component system, NtrC family, response regulator HydG
MTLVQTASDKLAILVVDDELIVRESLGAWFREDGYQVETAENARDALRLAAAKRYDVAFLDIKMPGVDGLELQAKLKELVPDLAVVVMTAYASVDSAVRALKAGAQDYIVKPFDPEQLSALLRRIEETRALRSENLRLKSALDQSAAAPPIIGDSPAMRRVAELIASVAKTDATVLIHGESGTGKELVARAIHQQSSRRYNPLVAVHCGALAEGILESELFGHEKGAFTGAAYHHKGKFEQADGGSIFLDEIGEISSKVQVELLRVLEEKRVTRVGGKSAIPVDFRVIAATHRDLRAMAKAGEFREDLFWRLDVVSVEIPPLRDRREDIPLLAKHFVEQLGKSMNKRNLQITPAALEALQECDWPGNVRELQNAIERAVVLGRKDVIDVIDLPTRPAGGAPASGARSLAELERAHIQRTLDETGWNITHAAGILEVDRGTLYNKIRKYELVKPDHVA